MIIAVIEEDTNVAMKPETSHYTRSEGTSKVKEMRNEKTFFPGQESGSRRRNLCRPSTVPRDTRSPATCHQTHQNARKRLLAASLHSCQGKGRNGEDEAHSACSLSDKREAAGAMTRLHDATRIREIRHTGSPENQSDQSDQSDQIRIRARGRQGRPCGRYLEYSRIWNPEWVCASLPLPACMDQTEAACPAASL